MIKYLLFFLFASTSMFAQTQYSILEARNVDQEGIATHLGEIVELTGITVGPNLRQEGLTFVLFDAADNIGITVFLFNSNLDHAVVEGDELYVRGELTQFRGLTEIEPDSISILSSSNPVPDAEEITTLNEASESKKVIFRNATLVNPDDWSPSGEFNVDITNGTDTIAVRIIDESGISGMGYPTGTFDVTGIGSQFDTSEPLFSGYQLLPTSPDDISPYVPDGSGLVYQVVTLEQARANNADGEPMLDGEFVELSGITHGINFRPGGLQCFILNENNVGVGIFSTSDMGYNFQEGDELNVQGRLTHFNGLTQIEPDSVWVGSMGNILLTADNSQALDESTEASLVRIEGNIISSWVGDGSSFNFDLETTSGDTIAVRVDSDSEVAVCPDPGALMAVTGFGSQFDSSVPRNSGYQLLVRFKSDLEIVSSTFEILDGDINVFPNPVNNKLFIDSEESFDRLEIFDVTGKSVFSFNGAPSEIDLSYLSDGIYFLNFKFGKESLFKRIIKQ